MTPNQQRQSTEGMDFHVQYLLSQCAQQVYSLKLLRHQGMPPNQLAVVTKAIIIFRIIYALPALGGFLSAQLVGKINAFFKRHNHFGSLQCHIDLSDLLHNSDHDLFYKVCTPAFATESCIFVMSVIVSPPRKPIIKA